MITITLPDIQELEKILEDDLPSKSGVYFIFNNNIDLCYVGKAKNIRGRICVHQNINMQFYQVPKNEICMFSYILVGEEYSRRMVEAIYIEKYKPKYNLNPSNSGWGGNSHMTYEDERVLREMPTKKIKV
jgi:excinuclease UvrABC nuclease subunit